MDVAINSERFSANDVEIFWFGRVIPGVIELMYKEKQDVTPVKVVGNRKDAGYVRGNVGIEASITLLQEEVFGLQKAAGGSILNIKGDLTVTMVRNGITVKETLKNAVPKENPREIKGGTTDALQAQIPLYVSDIKVYK